MSMGIDSPPPLPIPWGWPSVPPLGEHHAGGLRKKTLLEDQFGGAAPWAALVAFHHVGEQRLRCPAPGQMALVDQQQEGGGAQRSRPSATPQVNSLVIQERVWEHAQTLHHRHILPGQLPGDPGKGLGTRPNITPPSYPPRSTPGAPGKGLGIHPIVTPPSYPQWRRRACPSRGQTHSLAGGCRGGRPVSRVAGCYC